MVDLNGTLLVQFLNFFILVGILAKFAYKPLVKIMEERQTRIARDLDEAEKARIGAQELEESYKEQLNNARMEAQAIVEKATKDAEAAAKAQLDEARAQIAKEKEKAQSDIAREREQAMTQIREEVVGLSLSLAGKVLGKNMDSDMNTRLINDAIDKLDSKSIGL